MFHSSRVHSLNPSGGLKKFAVAFTNPNCNNNLSFLIIWLKIKFKSIPEMKIIVINNDCLKKKLYKTNKKTEKISSIRIREETTMVWHKKIIATLFLM